MKKPGRPREFSDADIRVAFILRERGFKWRHVALIMGRDSYSLVNAIRYSLTAVNDHDPLRRQ